MTEETTEIKSLLTEIKTGWSGVSALPAEVKTLREGNDKLATDLKEVRRQVASRHASPTPHRRGVVSEAGVGAHLRVEVQDRGGVARQIAVGKDEGTSLSGVLSAWAGMGAAAREVGRRAGLDPLRGDHPE